MLLLVKTDGTWRIACQAWDTEGPVGANPPAPRRSGGGSVIEARLGSHPPLPVGMPHVEAGTPWPRDDTLYGDGGDDELEGGAGADDLFGAAGLILAPWNSGFRRRSNATRRDGSLASPFASAILGSLRRLYRSEISTRTGTQRHRDAAASGKCGFHEYRRRDHGAALRLPG
jgi:hypothetical protein